MTQHSTRWGPRLLCRYTYRNLSALADGELAGLRRQGVEAHLRYCERCRAEARSFRTEVQEQQTILRAAVTVASPDTDVLLRGTLRKIEEGERRGKPILRWYPVLAGGLAAGAAAVLFLVVLRTQTARDHESTETGTSTRFSRVDSAGRVVATGTGSPGEASDAGRLVRRERAEPPRELLDRPDMFVEYHLLERLDALEHFDAVWHETRQGRLERRQG